MIVDGVLAAAMAATSALLLGGTASPPSGEPPAQPPTTLTPEQSARLCQEAIPALLARIDRLQERVEGGPAVAGSTAWLEARIERAREERRPAVVERLEERLAARPDRLARLADVEQRATAFRDARCAS